MLVIFTKSDLNQGNHGIKSNELDVRKKDSGPCFMASNFMTMGKSGNFSKP